MRFPGILTIASLLFLLFPSTDIRAGVRTVWAVNDGEKVDRDDLSNPNKLSNSAWDGEKIRVFGARNEILAFQVIVESDAAGIDSLAVALPELKHSDGKAKIVYVLPDKDPTLYVGRPIQIFSEHYLHVTSPTQAGWIYKLGTPSAPRNPTGWKPVQLVPENAKKGEAVSRCRLALRQIKGSG